MTKKEVAKELRKRLTEAIKTLPEDVEYQSVSLFEDATTQDERDYEAHYGGNATGNEGALHVIELTVEECRQ
jgi:DNA-directed RNA polymerase specialized sigma subunit